MGGGPVFEVSLVLPYYYLLIHTQAYTQQGHTHSSKDPSGSSQWMEKSVRGWVSAGSPVWMGASSMVRGVVAGLRILPRGVVPG